MKDVYFLVRDKGSWEELDMVSGAMVAILQRREEHKNNNKYTNPTP